MTSEKDISIIMRSRRTLLVNNKDPWLKKSGNEEFDVPMGCFDGAEVCELVGVYILHLLRTVMRKEEAYEEALRNSGFNEEFFFFFLS